MCVSVCVRVYERQRWGGRTRFRGDKRVKEVIQADPRTKRQEEGFGGIAINKQSHA